MGLRRLVKRIRSSLVRQTIDAAQQQITSDADALGSDKQDLEKLFEKICGIPSEDDRMLYTHPLPTKRNMWKWLQEFADAPDVNILEIGSREIVNRVGAGKNLPLARYTGFDLHPGPGVDVVGDAHSLSNHFAPGSFDVVIAIAVFEHLAMPWIVAEEISKILRVGGVACIYTHFSWSEHEMPWHFFQFNSTGLEVLFNKHLGFETIEAGKGLPMVGRFAYDCDDRHRGKAIGHLYCSSNIISRKIFDGAISDEKVGFDWRAALQDAYAGTSYPENTSVIHASVGTI